MHKPTVARQRDLLRLLVASVALFLVLIPVTVAEAAPFGSRILKLGSAGSDVKTLQRYLTTAGFRTSADGHFGNGTRVQVGRWQRSAKRAVTGRVTKSDAKALQLTVRRSFAGGVGGAVAAPEPPPPPQPASTQPAADPNAPAGRAKLAADGTAIAPADAPDAVKRVIAAGNRIASTPYVWGGGHGSWTARGYDCSGSVSFALHGGGLLDEPMVSGAFMDWGAAGRGKWITTYAHGGHMFMTVAGLRFDTSGATAAGSRWQTASRSTSGFTVRHPVGY